MAGLVVLIVLLCAGVGTYVLVHRADGPPPDSRSPATKPSTAPAGATSRRSPEEEAWGRSESPAPMLEANAPAAADADGPLADDAAATAGETLELTLEQALLFQRAGGRVENRDLHVELARAAGGGKYDANGWAWCDAMPGLDSAVSVVECDANESRLRLVLEMTVGHYPPAYVGGRARYTVDLERSCQTLRGSYSGEIRSIAGRKKPADEPGIRRPAEPEGIQGRVVPGSTASVLEVAEARYRVYRPVVARGVIRAGRAPAAMASGMRPRLLLGLRGVKQLTDWSQTPSQRGASRLLWELGPAPTATPGGEAAARAVANFRMGGLPADAQRRRKDALARAAGRAAGMLTERRHDAGTAKELAGLALAYDLAGDQWPEELRREVATALVATARRICAVGPEAKADDAIFGEGKLAGEPTGPGDYRLGALRCAAGLAWLAAEEEKANAAVPQAVRRSVKRLLATGIGERGAGSGSNELAEFMKLLYPFLQAWRRCTGEDLATGTGAQWLPMWGAFTRGQCFNRGPGYAKGPWMAMALPTVRREHRPAAMWHLARHGCEADDLWSAAVAAIDLPASFGEAASPPAAMLGLAWHDRRMGSVALRSGWDDGRDFLVMLEAGSGADEAAEMRQDLSVSGLGREWIRRYNAAGTASAWPRVEQLNVMQFVPNTMQKVGRLVPAARGYVETIRADAGGKWGSVAVKADGAGLGLDCLHEPRSAFVIESGSEEDRRLYSTAEASAWRTAGVDFSGASGAPALIVLVDGARGTRPWLRAWEIDVGDVPAADVRIEGASFTVRPRGGKASMKGTFLYPDGVVDGVRLSYVAPAKGLGGRVRAMLDKPGRVVEPELMLEPKKKTGRDVLEGLGELTGKGVEAKPDEAEDDTGAPVKGARRELLKSVMFNLLRKHSSSVSMGGGDRWGKAEGSCVVVLTVQASEAPAVTAPKDPEAWLCKVGAQTVWYREYLVEFEKK